MLEFDEYKVWLNNFKPQLETLKASLGLDQAARELDLLQSQSAAPGFWGGGADMLFIALSLGLILLFHLEFTTLREGTWVSMLLLGWSMALTFPAARKCSPYCWLKEHYPEALN